MDNSRSKVPGGSACHNNGTTARFYGISPFVTSMAWRGVVVALLFFSAINTAFTADAPQAGPIRLAAGGFSTLTDSLSVRAEEGKLTDLLTAQLSKSGRFDLVERREIDSVVAEMSLSLSSISRRDDAIKIGKLLRADWLLVGSLSQSPGTNSAVVKILDARSGVILDLAAISMAATNSVGFTAAIADFAENAATRVGHGEQRVFIGIGGFADLGVNSRYPDFRKQLRATLEKTYQGTHFAVVERTMVEPLLTELRLNLGGLSGVPANGPTAQPAFLLVDGCYQAFQDKESKINVILRVQEIGGQQRLFPLNELPGAKLDEKIIAILNDALTELRSTNAPASRKDEAIVQLNRGRERSRVEDAGVDYHFLGGYDATEEQRARNVAEAIEAFQACLLLDPDNVGAKLYLGICLLDRSIRRPEDARNYLSEVIASGAEATVVDKARDEFVASCSGGDDRGMLELILSQGNSAVDPAWRATILRRADKPVSNLNHRGLLSTDQCAAVYERSYLFELDAFERGIKRPTFYFPQNAQGIFGMIEGVSSNRAEAEQRLETFLPQATQTHPGLTPFIWSSYAMWRGNGRTPISTLVVKALNESLALCRDHPEKVSQCGAFYNQYAPAILQWCAANGQYSAGEAAWQIACQVRKDKTSRAPLTWFNLGMANTIDYYGAYCEMGQKKWSDALAILTPLNQAGGYSQSVLKAAGPWGPEGTHVAAMDWANQCHTNLGQPIESAPKERSQAEMMAMLAKPSGNLPPGVRSANMYVANGALVTPWGTQPSANQPPPGQLELGEPVLTTDDRRTRFVCDGDKLWVSIGGEPSLFHPADHSLKALPWPANAPTDIICIDQDQDSVWWGTYTGGLVEMDKRTLETKVYGPGCGLPMPNITALHRSADRLWIGFGDGNFGGVGYLDMPSRKYVGLTAELKPDAIGLQQLRVRKSSSEEPPRSIVRCILQNGSDGAWICSDDTQCQYYSFAHDNWTSVSIPMARFVSKLVVNPNCMVACGNGSASGVWVMKRSPQSFGEVQLRNWLKSGKTSLPIRTTCVALDGNHIWVGGQMFLALVNLESLQVEKICEFGDFETYVNKIEVLNDEVWIAVDNHIYRIARAGA